MWLEHKAADSVGGSLPEPSEKFVQQGQKSALLLCALLPSDLQNPSNKEDSNPVSMKGGQRGF